MKFLYENSFIEGHDMAQFDESIKQVSKKMRDALDSRAYEVPESFVYIPDDEDLLKKIKTLRHDLISPYLKYLVVIGIGGSSLGTKAVYHALKRGRAYPIMLFAETCDSDEIKDISDALDGLSARDEFLICVVSKSGKTTETLANASFIISHISRFKDYKKRIVCITEKHSPLWELASQSDLLCVEIPNVLTGRYSIFSAVGLLPLSFLFDSLKFCRGARDMRTACLSQDIFKNPSALFAIIQFLSMKAGKDVFDMFLFSPYLENLGKWYRHLLAESIGKNKFLNVIPTVSIGPPDLHSTLERYLGGPNNVITAFISSDAHSHLTIPESAFGELVEKLKGKAFSNIISILYEGAKNIYMSRKRSFVEIRLSEISEYTLGEFLMFSMMSVVYLAELMDIDPFTQPNVEGYKKEVGTLLKH